MLRLLSLVACIVLAGAAHGQETRGLYLGVGYGLFSYDEVNEEVGIRISDSSGGYRLLGGFQLNSNYAIELGWAKTDDISESFFARDILGNVFTLDIDSEIEVATLRALALAPVGGFSMFGGLGYYDAKATTRARFAGPDGVEEMQGKSDDSGFTVVGGMQYDWSRISIRGEYEWFDTDGDTDASSINVNVLFRF